MAQDIMHDLFSGRLAMEPQPSAQLSELGTGFGIGMYGGYQKYVKNLSRSGTDSAIYIGKGIDKNNGSYFITDETTSFSAGDDVIVLVKYQNLSHKTALKLEWRTEDGELLYRSHFDIPAPYAVDEGMIYWKEYGAYFYAPQLGSGNYSVKVFATELRPAEMSQGIGLTGETVEANIDFSID